MDCGKTEVDRHSISRKHVLTRSRRLYATVTFHPSRELHRKMIHIFTEEVQGIKTTANLTTSLVVQPLHINSIKAMKERGGNALGIESDGSLLSESLMPTIRGDCDSRANQPTHQQLHSLHLDGENQKTTVPFTTSLRGGLTVPRQRLRRLVFPILGSTSTMLHRFRTRSRLTVKLASSAYRKSSGVRTRREFSPHRDLFGALLSSYELNSKSVVRL